MKKRHNLFIGFKASRAIPVRNNLTRDFLVQSTLDSGVRRIDYQADLLADERIVPVCGIILERFDGRYAVDIVDARPACDSAAEMLQQIASGRNCAGIIEVGAADIRAEPRFSSAREVWSYRTVHVHGDDRLQILEALENEGPVELARLDGLVMTRGEARATIYSMACEGSVELDLRDGLDADTVVRIGQFGFSASLRAYGP
jgi:hypothetical protein